MEIYNFTFSTKCRSWTSWFQLRFLQIKSTYDYNFLHIVLYFGLFYCLSFSKMFNVCRIIFFKIRFFFIQIKCYSLVYLWNNLNWIFIDLIAFFEVRLFVKILRCYCSFLSTSISISSLICRKPSFIFQTAFINCTFLLNYISIVSYNILYLLTPPYYEEL